VLGLNRDSRCGIDGEGTGYRDQLHWGGRANARRTTIEDGIVDRLKIGDALLENVPAMALASLESALRGNGRIEDLVILGTNILEQFLTTWDNDKLRLVLSPRYDPRSRRQHLAEYISPHAKPMPFYMVPDHYLIAHGAIANREAAFFVDTGLVTVDTQGRQPAPNGFRQPSHSLRSKGRG